MKTVLILLVILISSSVFGQVSKEVDKHIVHAINKEFRDGHVFFWVKCKSTKNLYALDVKVRSKLDYYICVEFINEAGEEALQRFMVFGYTQIGFHFRDEDLYFDISTIVDSLDVTHEMLKEMQHDYHY